MREKNLGMAELGELQPSRFGLSMACDEKP
jgi:hypothetical protein